MNPRAIAEDKAKSTISNAILQAVKIIREANPSLSFEAALAQVQMLTTNAFRVFS